MGGRRGIGLDLGWINRSNVWVAATPFGRWFRLDGSNHPRERKDARFWTEIRAGLATFFAMAYVIAVNASIISATGGTCVCPRTDDDPACDSDVDYALCVEEVRRDLVTATAAIAALSTFFMGALANLPVGLAPGMGLNAYFAYNVVGYHGTGAVPYEVALTATFVEGFIFFALALLGMRQWLARAIPHSIKMATSAGIGFFLTMIGLTYSEGIGLIVGSQSTPLELAGCREADLDGDGLCPSSTKMRNPAMWIGIFCGGILTAVLMLYRVKGAIIAGILLVSIISWPRNTPVTYFPDTEVGDSNFDFFKQVVDFHEIRQTLNVQRWDISGYGGQFGLALITFLYVDILDTTGTLYSMAQYSGVVDPTTEDFEGSSIAYMVDALSISIGALFGTSPVTAFVESGAGIAEGGKTGITAMSAGVCFFISIFLSPIFASFPPWATGCVLILVGSMMARSATYINWKYAGDAIPAFITMVLMPFTYSIADGLIAGICTYILINTIVYMLEKVSGGRIIPQNKHEKEPWTWRMPGGFWPPWAKRLVSQRGRFWKREPDRVDIGIGSANDTNKGGSIRSGVEAVRSSEGSVGISTADEINDDKQS